MPVRSRRRAGGPTMTGGKRGTWHKRGGDPVAIGDVSAESETDKATMEGEAVDEGRIGRILVQEGTEGVAVNTPIALLLEEGEEDSALESAGGMTGNGKAGEAQAEKPVTMAAPKTEARIDEPAGMAQLAVARPGDGTGLHDRSEEHTSDLQSLMRIPYAVFCLKKKK